MTRLRNAALLATTVAIAASGILVPTAASAAATPRSRVKSDLAKIKKAEHAYAKTHRAVAKELYLFHPDSTRVGKYRIAPRAKEELRVDLGHEGKKRGYCATVRYTPLHGVEGRYFAYYDSILKVTRYKAKGFKVGGACYSHAAQQEVTLDGMREDLANGIVAEQDYLRAYPNGGPGFAFVNDWRHPEATKLPKDIDLAGPYRGDVVRAVVNNHAKGYCITVTNKVAKIKKHSYYYSSTTDKTRHGTYGDDKTGACAK